MEIEEIKDKVRRIITEELGDTDHHAFFFGSRVTGTAGKTSDLDVGIEGENPVPPTKMQSIRLKVESLATLVTIDVVDFANLSNDFKTIAKEKIEEIK